MLRLSSSPRCVGIRHQSGFPVFKVVFSRVIFLDTSVGVEHE